MTAPDVVRRWIRVLEGLRARSLKVRRPDSPATGPVDRLLADALDACDGAVQDLAGARLECDQLRRELQAEGQLRQHLFDRIPVACVATNDGGLIQNANQPAAELFNVSTKHLRDRELLHFAADRDAFMLMLRALPFDDSRLQAVMRIRPRERSLFKLHALVVPEQAVDPASWLWFLTPDGDGASTPASTRHQA